MLCNMFVVSALLDSNNNLNSINNLLSLYPILLNLYRAIPHLVSINKEGL